MFSFRLSQNPTNIHKLFIILEPVRIFEQETCSVPVFFWVEDTPFRQLPLWASSPTFARSAQHRLDLLSTAVHPPIPMVQEDPPFIMSPAMRSAARRPENHAIP